MGPVTIWLTAWSGSHDWASATGWALMVICLSVLPLFVYIYMCVRSGRMTDIHVGIREQRHSLFLMAILLIGATLAVLYLADSPMPLKPLLLSMLASISLNALINIETKISLHASAFTGSLVVFYYLFGRSTLVPMLPLLLLVMWSRVRLGQHTAMQVIVGALVSGTVTASIFGDFLT